VEPVVKDESAPTEVEPKARETWQGRALRAVGELYLAISDGSLVRILMPGSSSSLSRCAQVSPCLP
jgi:hypothetical protein